MLALVLIGQMRTWNDIRIINSYKNYLSKYGNIDLYIFTWDKTGFSNHHGSSDIHSRMDEIISETDIKEHYKKYNFLNIKHVLIENYDSFIKNLDDNIIAVPPPGLPP